MQSYCEEQRTAETVVDCVHGCFEAQCSNNVPRITAFSPPEELLELKEGDTRIFVIGAADDDGDSLQINWVFDGAIVSSNQNVFTYFADENSSGRHELVAMISDGFSNVSRSWQLNVLDVLKIIKLPRGSIKRISPGQSNDKNAGS